MVVDTSVLIAIVRGEDDAEAFAFQVAHARERPRISSVSLVEAGMVLSRDEFQTLLELIHRIDIEVVEFSAAMALVAVQAARAYGKGRGRSKAQLNFGDCCSYATAKVLKFPLLFKGNDFVHTDVQRPE